MARRDGPRGHRDPRQDRSGRRRHHDRRDRRERSRLPRPRPLALGAAGPRQAASPTPTPVRRSPSPSTRIAPARCSSSSSRRPPAGRSVTVTERPVGKTRFEKLDLDAAGITTQAAFIESLARKGDPDLVLDVRIVGVRPDELDLQPEEIESALAPSFLKVRVRDVSLPALTEGTLPSARHDRRRVHPRPRGAHRRARGDAARTTAPEIRRPRPPSCAMPFGSGGSCLPGTRCRCEDPAAPGPRPAPLSRARHRPGARA